MRKIRSMVMSVLLAALILCSFSASRGPASAASAENQAIQQAVSRYNACGSINVIRRSLGLSVLTQQPLLDQTAENHSAYMNTANQLSFEEVPGETGYTGGYPVDRSRFAGYTKQYVTEYDNYRMVTFEDFVAWCMRDPYLRTSLLNPNYGDIGMGRSGYYYCMVLGGSGYEGEPMTTVYPYAGQQDVGTIYYSSLSHFPEAMSEVRSLGIPITVQYYAAGLSDLRFKDIKAELLNTETEKTERLHLVAPGDTDGLWNTLILFPMGEYQASTRYTVSVAFDVYQEDVKIDTVEEKWSFTTVGPDYLGGVRSDAVLTMFLEAMGAPQTVFDEQIEQLRTPENSATREEAIVWLIDLLDICAPDVMSGITADFKETFEDINQCEENTREKVQIAYQLNLIEDQGRGILNPKALLTRAELDRILVQLHERFATVEFQWEEEEPAPEPEPEQEPAPEPAEEEHDQKRHDEEESEAQDVEESENEEAE
ncbi:MAG: CAP domain-containing protein [Clostridiales bacterium]|nr:CAP domain-containing protein [Clostridiales bacterium]